MNKRDDYFYQAVIYAKEKNHEAARAMLRNLLYQYPDDIEGLLLYSIVAKNKQVAIQVLKRILVLDPDHEIAFQKLAELKNTPHDSIPTPAAPLPTPPPTPTELKARTLEPALVQSPALTRNPSRMKERVERSPGPKAPEEVIERKNLEPSQIITNNNNGNSKRKQKRNLVDMILIGLLILTCLCVSVAALQQIIRYFIAGG